MASIPLIVGVMALTLFALATTSPALATPGQTFGVGEAGPTGPIFSGPQQQPFLCETEASGLGRPLVDNHDGIGMAVYDDGGNLLGYSQYCSAPMQIRYVYRSTDGTFKHLPDRAVRPADLARTMTSDGLIVDYIVRIEMGTINRFVYGIAMLAPYDGAPHNPFIKQPWNGKLLYYFGGGVGIGNRQGRFRTSDILRDEVLSQGWAVVHSTGNVTSQQYNLVLAGETAMMVKDHFVARYGEPIYTIGVGASGGAIQQHIIAQNHPGLLDGLVPVDSYPEMVSQAIYVGDCELMEYLFDTSDEPRWESPVAREVFEGLAGNEEMGRTACVDAWRGLTQLAMNPNFQKPDLFAHLLNHFPAELVLETKYTHWNDLRNIYGVDENGIAPNSWDNVGVQYGLKSVQNGSISKEDFFWMNEVIGGWAQPGEMKTVSMPYDVENQRRGRPGQPNRTTGDIGAMQKAYLSGHMFTGHVVIPMIDTRNYKDDILDMHHFLQSFATRERIERVHGHSDHHVIWVADDETPLPLPWMAVSAMDEWLTNMRNNPRLTVAQARPLRVVDTCWAADGSIIAAGDDVWAEGSALAGGGIFGRQIGQPEARSNDAEQGGVEDSGSRDAGAAGSGSAATGPQRTGTAGNEAAGNGTEQSGTAGSGATGSGSSATEPQRTGTAPGPCRQAFPTYENSRTLAGAPVSGDVFKCQLMSVDEAIVRGLYPTEGPNAFTEDDYDRLYELFPDGVCDYTKPDAGLPPGWTW